MFVVCEIRNRAHKISKLWVLFSEQYNFTHKNNIQQLPQNFNET